MNEPAFPANPDNQFPGMSLRDWFAGRALAPLIADNDAWEVFDSDPGKFAGAAYEFADAMMREREK